MKNPKKSIVKKSLLFLCVCTLLLAGFPISPHISAYATDAGGLQKSYIGEALTSSSPNPEMSTLEKFQMPSVTLAPLTAATTTKIRITGDERYDYAYQIFTLINQERSKWGLGPLTMNADLIDPAMQRAAEATVYFEHTRPNGKGALTVSALAKSENLYVNTNSSYFGPADVVYAWMSSTKGHRENILNSRWKSTGIGVFVHEGRTYWVQLFSETPTSTSSVLPPNVTTSREVEIISSTCVFPKAEIVSDTSLNIGETKNYKLKLYNPFSEISSWAFCCPDMNYGITYSSSDTTCLQVLAGTMKGLSGGTVVLRAGINGFVIVEKNITVNSTTPGVKYKSHVQGTGDQLWASDGNVSGTTGSGLRLEAIWIELTGNLTGNFSGGVSYQTYVQGAGWQNLKSNGVMSGTIGQSLRIEAIKINLTGNIAAEYDIYYRVHCQSYGWLGWAKNGDPAGSEGLSLRLEAIQITLVKKGAAAQTNLKGITSASSASFSGGAIYQSHVQYIGWQGWVGNGAMSGTSGQSLRLEAIQIKLTSNIPGGISYRSHVQNIGWQNWVSNGATSGTSGQSLRLEAIEIKLTGDAEAKYDVWYRVHIQNYGWLGWARNGASAGSEGKSLRMEAIEIRVLPKGSPAPGSTTQPFIK